MWRWSRSTSSTSLPYPATATSGSCLTRRSRNSQSLRRGMSAVASHVRILYHRDAVLRALTHVVAKPLRRWRQCPTPSKLMSSSCLLPSGKCVLALMMICRRIHSQTPALHLRSVMRSTSTTTMSTTTMTTTSPVQVLARPSPTSSSTALSHTQLTAAMPAHPLTAVTRTRLCAALCCQACLTSSPLR